MHYLSYYANNVTILYNKKQVSIFIDFTQDDSYTPKSISIRGGTTYRDLHVRSNRVGN